MLFICFCCFFRSATTSLWRHSGVHSLPLWWPRSHYARSIRSGTAASFSSMWSSTLLGTCWSFSLSSCWAFSEACGERFSSAPTWHGADYGRIHAWVVTLYWRWCWSLWLLHCWPSLMTTHAWVGAIWSQSSSTTAACSIPHSCVTMYHWEKGEQEALILATVLISAAVYLTEQLDPGCIRPSGSWHWRSSLRRSSQSLPLA